MVSKKGKEEENGYKTEPLKTKPFEIILHNKRTVYCDTDYSLWKRNKRLKRLCKLRMVPKSEVVNKKQNIHYSLGKTFQPHNLQGGDVLEENIL